MSKIRYLLDENVDPALRIELLRKEPLLVVWKVGDPGAPKLGATDPEILVWCQENKFILVTNNRRSMPGHLHGHIEHGGHVPGIFQLSPKLSTHEIVDDLLLIWGASELEEYQNLMLYLPFTL